MKPDDVTIRDLAASQHGYVATRQLARRGVDHRLLQRRIESGVLERVTRQVLHLVGAPPTEEAKAAIAVLDGPDGSILSHKSAAALWGLPGFVLHRDLHVVVPTRGRPRRTRTATVHYHLGLPGDQLVTFRGLPVTTPLLTMFHLAAICNPGRVARAFDTAWSEGLLTGPLAERLLERLAASGRNGIRTMRSILEERGPGYVPPQSGNEARFLEIITNAGIPEPRRQVDLGGRYWIGRVDFLFDDLPGVVEVLSRRYHTSFLDRKADEARFRRLHQLGLTVLSVWDEDIWRRPLEVVGQVRKYRWWLEGSLDHPPTGVLLHKTGA